MKLFSNPRVRTTLTLSFNGEEKDLVVTFNVIDKISGLIDWASLPIKMGSGGQMPITEMSKLVYYALIEAGFKDVEIDDIYDSMRLTANKDEGVLLAMQICKAFSPQVKKKDSKEQEQTRQEAEEKE